jgi:hypothetical protein
MMAVLVQSSQAAEHKGEAVSIWCMEVKFNFNSPSSKLKNSLVKLLLLFHARKDKTILLLFYCRLGASIFYDFLTHVTKLPAFDVNVSNFMPLSQCLSE